MKRLTLVLSLVLVVIGCKNIETPQQKMSLFIGVDVSGSFYNSGHYEDALDFISYYIYGHMTGAGELKTLKTLFVGSIGGNTIDEAKAFHPIEDFDGKSVDEIRAELKKWFVKSDANTDFNVFFKQVALIAQKRNLSLSPLTVVLLSDGLPDLPETNQSTYEAIDVSPMEYTSRNTTIRLLYASPVAANKWETVIPRKRVRMWTVDNQVMQGWKAQVRPDVRISQQAKLWGWITDNVDFRVQPVRVIHSLKKK